MSIFNISSYRFVSLSQSQFCDLHEKLRPFCKTLDLKGSVMLSREGINFMLAGEENAVRQFQVFLEKFPFFKSLVYKESLSDAVPFKRLFIKIKKQLTPFTQEVQMTAYPANYISPTQLKAWLDEEKEFVLLDVRNQYEIEQGGFKKSISLNIKHFKDFTVAIEQLPKKMKSQVIVSCCTGGIRCEKVVPWMQQEGFKEVYQLEGGILQYFKECGDVHYQGDCYVFDERMVVKPSNYLRRNANSSERAWVRQGEMKNFEKKRSVYQNT